MPITDQINIAVGITDGEYNYVNFADIPNVLISGTTGSGKTAFVQTLIYEMMQEYSPEDVLFILFDSKGVDYRMFNFQAHLLMPVLNDPDKMDGVVGWLEAQSKYRLDHIEQIQDCPHIFLILDDFSELASGSISDQLFQLFQTSRQTRIHCWIVTSTPTSAVIPTELKAYIYTRVAFHTTSRMLSQSVINEKGAETLRVPGEMIFKQYTDAIRCQAVYYSDDEIVKIQNEIVEKYPHKLYDDLVREKRAFRSNHIKEIPKSPWDEIGDLDELFVQAARFVIEKGKASPGMLQRMFRIGFTRSERILNQLYVAGVIGEEEGTKPRKVLMTEEEFERFITEDFSRDAFVLPPEKESRSQEKKIYCANCGMELPDNSKFCFNCGTPLEIKSDLAKEQTVTSYQDESSLQNGERERKALLQELAGEIDYFSKYTSLYEEFDLLNEKSIPETMQKTKYSVMRCVLVYILCMMVGFGIIVILCCIGNRLSPITGILTFFSAVFIGLILPCIYSVNKALNARKAKKKVQELCDQRDDIADKLTEYYHAFGTPIVGIEYTNPNFLQKIYDVIQLGKADTPQEAIELLERDDWSDTFSV